MPNMGFQSTIDNPDPVNLVKPPITIIKNAIVERIRSHIEIPIWFLESEWIKCIKDLYLLEIVIKVVN